MPLASGLDSTLIPPAQRRERDVHDAVRPNNYESWREKESKTMISRPRKELERNPKKRRETKGNPKVTESRGALSELLAPLAPKTFTAGYWGRKALFIKGAPDKLQRLFPGGFQRADLYRATRQAAGKNIADFKVQAGKHQSRKSGLDEESRSFPTIHPDQIETTLTAGANIRADNICDERVARFAAALKTQLNHPGNVRLLVTLSSQGFGWPAHVISPTRR
jgi:hypothetical protein